MKRMRFHIQLRKHKDRVFSYAMYLCKNRDDAEDITQEVFVKMWNNWNQIDHKKLKSWLIRVTHNHCMDYIRRRKVVQYRQTSIQDVTVKETASFVDRNSNPEHIAEKGERYSNLMQMIETLPLNTKSILMLHYFQGLQLNAISELMNLNINTVKVTLHRGRKMLKKAIEQDYPEMVEALDYD